MMDPTVKYRDASLEENSTVQATLRPNAAVEPTLQSSTATRPYQTKVLALTVRRFGAEGKQMQPLLVGSIKPPTCEKTQHTCFRTCFFFCLFCFWNVWEIKTQIIIVVH